MFPLNIRMLVAGWKLLFLDRAGLPARPGAERRLESRRVSRRRASRHCGACHTPRNFLGAEKKRDYLAGGDAEGWHAPALNASSRAPVPWTAESLFRYLRARRERDERSRRRARWRPSCTTWRDAPERGRARDRDLHRFASSGRRGRGARSSAAKRRCARARAASAAADCERAEAASRAAASDTAIQAGGVIYGATCALCHGSAQRAAGRAVERRAASRAQHVGRAADARATSSASSCRAWRPPTASAARSCPAFAGALTDEQVAALVTYLRATYTDRPAWPNVDREVRRVRKSFAEVQ